MIVITGECFSGKTTLHKELVKRFSYNVVESDEIFYKFCRKKGVRRGPTAFNYRKASDFPKQEYYSFWMDEILSADIAIIHIDEAISLKSKVDYIYELKPPPRHELAERVADSTNMYGSQTNNIRIASLLLEVENRHNRIWTRLSREEIFFVVKNYFEVEK